MLLCDQVFLYRYSYSVSRLIIRLPELDYGQNLKLLAKFHTLPSNQATLVQIHPWNHLIQAFRSYHNPISIVRPLMRAPWNAHDLLKPKQGFLLPKHSPSMERSPVLLFPAENSGSIPMKQGLWHLLYHLMMMLGKSPKNGQGLMQQTMGGNLCQLDTFPGLGSLCPTDHIHCFHSLRGCHYLKPHNQNKHACISTWLQAIE